MAASVRIGRSDTPLALAALTAAIPWRRPPAGCNWHTDRGSKYASERYREPLAHNGLVGSMSLLGKPFDTAKGTPTRVRRGGRNT